MSEFLIIHYKPDTQSELFYWALGGDQHPSITLGHGSLTELKPIARGKKVTILIDSHYTSFESINVPSRNRSKQMQAVPFAMEDLLAEDIEDMHFALCKSHQANSDENKIPVIAIKRELLQQTLDFFKQYIHVDVITADSVALPVNEKQWSILLDETDALIKINASQAHCCDRDNLPIILQALLDQQNTKPESLTYFHKADDPQAEELLSTIDIETNINTYQNNALEVLVKNLNEVSGYNLLQGAFTVKNEGTAWLQPWKSVASIAGIWLILQLGYSSVLAKQLEEKNQKLNQQIETEFKRAIPDARKMTNMKKRVERRLKDLSSGGKSSSSNSFLNMLSKVAPILTNNNKINIKAAVYKNNMIDLDLSSKTLQDIEQVKSNLDAIAGIKSVLSTTVEKNQVKARLRLEAK